MTMARPIRQFKIWSVVMMSLAACSAMPTSTQGGQVREIVIGPFSVPLNVTVHQGDEVRWVNKREGEIQIVFLDSLEGKLNCKRGFGRVDVVNAAMLKPQQSVSVCFAEPGTLRYTVRLDRPLPSGWLNEQGRILVTELGDPGEPCVRANWTWPRDD